MVSLRRQLPAYSPLALSVVRDCILGLAHEAPDLRSRLAALLSGAYDAREALLVDSGTGALRLALAGVRAASGDRLIGLPAYCCYDVATAAEGAEANVLLYDLDPRTLGPDRVSFDRVLAQRPAVVVAAHLFGYPVDMDWLTAACRDAGVLLIEDAAQAGGGCLRGRPLGTFGSLTVLSFGRGKGTTAGAGGALLAHDDAGAGVVRWAASHVLPPSRGARVAAVLTAQWALGRPPLYWLPAAIPFLRLGEAVYRRPSPPRGMSGAALRALEGNGRPEAAALEIQRRTVTARRLLEHARSGGKVLPVEPIQEGVPGFLRLPLLSAELRLAPEIARLARHGVAAAYPAPLVSLHPFRTRVLNSGDTFEGANVLAERLLTFPTHSRLTESDVRALEFLLS